MLTFDYGTLPRKAQFMKAYENDKDLGDLDAPYRMTLRGEADTAAAEGTVFAEAIEAEAEFDADDMWKGIKQLKRKWDSGSDEAGDLASSLLYTLDIEWI